MAQTVGVNANDNEIYLMNADGTNPILLVSNLEGIIEAPSFSIDSKKVIFTRDVSGYSSGTNRQLDSHVFLRKLQYKLHRSALPGMEISLD